MNVDYRLKLIIIHLSLTLMTSAKQRFSSSFLRETQRFEADLSSGCVDYPTAEFASYADCDMDWVHKQLPSGLLPFWASRNISLASDYWDQFEINHSNIYETLEYVTSGVSYVNIKKDF